MSDAPDSPAERVRPEAVSAQGPDLAWTLLPACPIAPGRTVDMIAIQPSAGLAILEIEPHWTPDAVTLLRASLAAGGFEAAFPGHLPVIHRRLRSEHLPLLRELLTESFVWQPPLTLAEDVDWVESLVRLLQALADQATAAAPDQPAVANDTRAPDGIRPPGTDLINGPALTKPPHNAAVAGRAKPRHGDELALSTQRRDPPGPGSRGDQLRVRAGGVLPAVVPIGFAPVVEHPIALRPSPPPPAATDMAASRVSPPGPKAGSLVGSTLRRRAQAAMLLGGAAMLAGLGGLRWARTHGPAPEPAPRLAVAAASIPLASATLSAQPAEAAVAHGTDLDGIGDAGRRDGPAADAALAVGPQSPPQLAASVFRSLGEQAAPSSASRQAPAGGSGPDGADEAATLPVATGGAERATGAHAVLLDATGPAGPLVMPSTGPAIARPMAETGAATGPALASPIAAANPPTAAVDPVIATPMADASRAVAPPMAGTGTATAPRAIPIDPANTIASVAPRNPDTLPPGERRPAASRQDRAGLLAMGPPDLAIGPAVQADDRGDSVPVAEGASFDAANWASLPAAAVAARVGTPAAALAGSPSGAAAPPIVPASLPATAAAAPTLAPTGQIGGARELARMRHQPSPQAAEVARSPHPTVGPSAPGRTKPLLHAAQAGRAAAAAKPGVPGHASVVPLAPATAHSMLKRGKVLMDRGDLAGARQLLSQAAERGSGQAALLLGASFAPDGPAPDPVAARHWLERAIALRQPGALDRLRALDTAGAPGPR